MIGRMRAQLPQCVIIYHGPGGGGGKPALFVLTKCVLGEENVGAVDPIALSTPGEFRRTAEEFTGRRTRPLATNLARLTRKFSTVIKGDISKLPSDVRNSPGALNLW